MNAQVIFRREGHWLVGRAEIMRRGSPRPQRFEARVNLLEVARTLRPWLKRHCAKQCRAAAAGGYYGGVGATIREKRNRLIKKAKRQGGQLSPAEAHELARLRAKIKKDDRGGFFGKLARSVSSVVNKVAKLQVLKSLGKLAKGALKLPGLSQAMNMAAMAFPPLGVPALVAFKSANMVLDAASKGGAAAQRLAGQIHQLKRVARSPNRAAREKARKALKVLQITHRWRRGLHAAQRQATSQAVRGLELPPARIPPVEVMLGYAPTTLLGGWRPY